MATKSDEIVDEIRRYREAHAASVNYDLKRITEDLQREERESGRGIVTRAPRRPAVVGSHSSVYYNKAMQPPRFGGG